MAINLGISYTTKEKQEFENITLERLKEGYSLESIGNFIGISRWTVKEIKDKLVYDKKITEEEIEQAKVEREKMRRRPIKNKILIGLMEGKSNVEISQDVSLTDVMVGNIVKELISEGEITEEEIEKRRTEREIKELEKLENVMLTFLEQGYSYREITPRTGLASKTITKIKNKLIKDGKISEEEIKKAQKERKRKIRVGEIEKDGDKNSDEEITEELKQRVLELLKNGYKPLSIPIKLEIERTLFYQIRDSLIAEGEITEEQIKVAQMEKGKRDRIIILRLLRQGYSQKEICQRIDEGKMYVQNRVNQFKKEKIITDEDIERWKFENNEKDAKELVLRGLRKGLTLEEIANSDETEFLDRDKAKKYKAELIEEGAITENEIRTVRKKTDIVRKRERRKNRVDVYDARILKLFELGFSQRQIEKILNLNYGYVRGRKETLILRKEISRTRIRNLRGKLEIKAEERREGIAKKFREGQDLKTNIVQDHIEYTKAKFDLGEVEEKDIDLLSKIIEITPNLITPGNVNLIITYYTREEKFVKAIRFVNGCIAECGNNEQMVEKLTKAADAIKLSEKRRNAKRMLDTGTYSLETIAGESGLSMIEVIELKKEMERSNTLSKEGKKQVPDGYGDDGEK